MPAAMVLPMAAAMPNHTPRTCRSLPRLGGRMAATLADGSEVVDNEIHRDFRRSAIILVRRENARPKAQPHNISNDFARTHFLHEVQWRQSARPLFSRN